MEHTYSTIRLGNWTEYKQLVDDLSENWAFRGQADTTWPLRNAIERTDFIQMGPGMESAFLAEFQRGARNYLQKDETPGHIIEWLALMQHHGAPTRLLDFTKSPFIAAYFAYEQCTGLPDCFVAVWAFHVPFLKDRALEALSADYAEELKATQNLIKESLFEKIFYSNNRSMIFPVEPFRMNRRYSLQQSLFVSTGISSEPFMNQLQFLGPELPKAVIKIELPAHYQKEALRDLQRMNLNRASLFPDLDGYALSLRLRYDSLRTPEELRRLEEKLEREERYPFFP
ncbi:MAG TPA: FRG domain-containing protein [Chitinophagaceae bacterium]|jgi:hypothetical protein|nr:FRG domain-containing protein [Chitinophagaceae bacterium]